MNNKGGALIMVIVIMSFISIIAALAMWMAYMNYYMKVTEMRSDNSFYSAEGVVEQIKVGLQNELSESTGDAYASVLQRYAEYSETDRNNYFYGQVVNAMRANLMGEAVNKYSLGNLVDFIDTENTDITPNPDTDRNAESYTVKMTDKKGKVHTAIVTGGNRLLTVKNTKVTLCDVNVEYTDANGYTSIINTDFTLQAPTLDFSDPNNSTSFLDYVVIADEHLKGQNTGAVNFTGNVYGGAGDRVADDAAEVDIYAEDYTVYEDPRNGIAIDGAGSTWTFNNAEKLICGSNISLTNGSEMITAGATELWTDDITLGGKTTGGNSVKLTLDGTSYVGDDLSIDGKNCTVKLSGSYYGYGVDDLINHETMEAAKDYSEGSSAILVNAKGTTLDMSGLESILLAGRSYVATRKIDQKQIITDFGVPKNELNIPMSESIAIRGNQVAYLVPFQAIATISGEAKATKNPMTKEEYEKIFNNHDIVDNENFKEVDLEHTTIPGSSVTLSTYAHSWQKVFAQGLHGDYLVYYYMVMNPEDANQYFATYYNSEANKVAIDKYLRVFTDGGIKTATVGTVDEDGELTGSDFTRIDVAGNWFTYDGKGSVDNAVYFHKPMTPNADELGNEELKYSNIFKALNAKLVTNFQKVTTIEQSQRPFENLVDDTKLPMGTKEYRYVDAAGDTWKGIATSGNYNYTGGDEIRMIIAEGNVTVNANFKGTILCKGTVEIEPGVTALINDSDVEKQVVYALNGREDPDDTTQEKMLKILKDGDQYDLGDEDTADTQVVTDMNDLVNYENWSKR